METLYTVYIEIDGNKEQHNLTEIELRNLMLSTMIRQGDTDFRIKEKIFDLLLKKVFITVQSSKERELEELEQKIKNRAIEQMKESLEDE